MNIAELIQESYLSHLDSELLLSHALHQSKEWLFTHPEYELTDEELEKFRELEQKRLSGISVAALLGAKEFYGLEFEVNEHVLVPRPETEMLVEEIIHTLTPQLTGGLTSSLLDVGTGSGCIAITVKKNLPDCEVVACDISPQALEVAKRNAEQHEVAVDFLESDVLGNVEQAFEIIVANLPYIPLDSKEVEAGVKDFEPDVALFGGVDGLDLIRKLLKQISELEQKPKYVLLEFGGGEQTEVLKKFTESLFPDSELEFKKDLAGIDRILISRLS